MWQTLIAITPTVGVLAAIMLAAYVLFRSKTSSVLQGELTAWKDKCDRLEEENKDLIATGHAKDVEIADYKARTDMTDIRVGQAAILEGQAKLLTVVQETSLAMRQMTTTLAAVETRLNRGLVMGGE